jgi:hypothetical protein
MKTGGKTEAAIASVSVYRHVLKAAKRRAEVL